MNKKFNFKRLVLGIVSLVYGVFLIFSHIFTVQITVNLLITLFLIFIIFSMLTDLIQKKLLKRNIVLCILLIIFKTFNAQTFISSSIVLLAVGIYQIMLATIYFITYHLYKKNGISHRLRYLIDAIILLILSIQTFVSPIVYYKRQFFILGVYLILIGIRYLREGFFFAHQSHTQLKRKIRIHVPIIFEALIPGAAFNKINHYLNQGLNPIANTEHTQSVDFEIYVHAMEGFQGATGHVDICFEDEVISYGCYDTPTTRFFGTISDGTLIKCNRDQYLKFCQMYQDRVFAFGISLNQKQKDAVREKIKNLSTLLIDWELDLDYHQKHHTQAYQLYEKTDTKFYKFQSSKFKTYFVATTNCCLLADTIIGEIGSDILNIRGVITPGTYLNYLNTEYQKEDSFVVSKKVY